MDNSGEILQALGRIEGTQEQILENQKQHVADDTRRFGELYKGQGDIEKRLAGHEGGFRVIRWLIGGGLTALAGTAYALYQIASKVS